MCGADAVTDFFSQLFYRGQLINSYLFLIFDFKYEKVCYYIPSATM